VTPRVPALVGAVLVGLLGLGALVSTAWHANSTAAQLVSAQQQREADYSNAYYSCLAAQGHRLLRPSDRVFVAQPNLDRWVILTKALGGWARLQAHRPHATVAVLLVDEPRRGHGATCDGQAIVSIRTTASGRVVMVRAAAPGGVAP
jgi:hypothetical protein